MLKRIPLTVAYAAWAGLGVELTVIVAAIFFRGGNTTMKVVSLTLIISGIYGLSINEGGH